MSTLDSHDSERRDFLYIGTGAFAAVGTAMAAWPFIDQMNPDASVKALASVEVDLAPIEEGQSVTISWRGNPVFVRHRTGAEIEESKSVPIGDLPDQDARNANLPDGTPATDVNRVIEGKEKFLVMIGVCTHLGCVPVGEAGEFEFDGGSAHAMARTTTRRGASAKAQHRKTCLCRNYSYISDTLIKIG